MRLSWRGALGVLVSLGFLWWAVRDISVAEVLREVRGADPFLFSLAILLATFAIPIRALRWQSLLRGVGSVPLGPRMAATSIGFAANNVLPARVGEIARAVSLQRLARVPLGGVLGSLVLERIFDAVVLLTFLFGSMASPGFPAGAELGGVDPRVATRWLAAATAALALLLGLAAFLPSAVLAAVDRMAEVLLPRIVRRPFLAALHSFVAGLAVLRDPRLFAVALAWSFAQWAVLGFSYDFGLRAFGIDGVGYAGALFLQSVTAFAVAVPSSPGFFGPFEAAVKLVLRLWDVPDGPAVSFAIGFHLGGFVTVTLLGFYYLWRSGLRWSEVERGAERAERDAAPVDSAARA